MAEGIKKGRGGKRLGAGRKPGHKPRPEINQTKIKRPKGRGGARRHAGRPYARVPPVRWCVYVVQEAENDGVCKIGVTGKSIEVRLSGLQVGNSRPLIIAACVPMPGRAYATQIERLLHRRLMGQRMRGEWFRISAEDALAAIGRLMVEEAITPTIKSQHELF